MIFVVNNIELFIETSDIYEIVTRISSNLQLPLPNQTEFHKCPQYLGINVHKRNLRNNRLKKFSLLGYRNLGYCQVNNNMQIVGDVFSIDTSKEYIDCFTQFDIIRSVRTFIVKIHYQVRTSIILAKMDYCGVNERDIFSI